MAIGTGHGRTGAVDAAKQAIAHPLLNISIKGARGVLFSVKGGDQLTLGAVNAAGELIGRAVRKDATIFFGMSVDNTLEDSVKMTLIATGLEAQGSRPSLRERLRGFVPSSKSDEEDGFQGI